MTLTFGCLLDTLSVFVSQSLMWFPFFALEKTCPYQRCSQILYCPGIGQIFWSSLYGTDVQYHHRLGLSTAVATSIHSPVYWSRYYVPGTILDRGLEQWKGIQVSCSHDVDVPRGKDRPHTCTHACTHKPLENSGARYLTF